MQRLIEHANSLKEANGEMADLSISSFANIVEAIHLVQVEMGISGISAEEAAAKVASGAMTQEEAFKAMGTTAKEASSTIQGSISSTSAAWKNLIVGVADDQADFDSLVNGFVESVSIAADNIIPRIRIALEGGSALIEKLLPVIVEKVSQIVSENLPIIVESGAKIVTSLVNGISDNKDTLIPAATDALKTIGTTIIELLPSVLTIGGDIITSLAKGIADALPDLIPKATDAILTITNNLTKPESVEELVGAALKIITELASGLSDALPELIPAAFKAILTIADKLTSEESILKLSGAALDVIIGLATGLINALPDLTQRVPEIIERLVNTLTSEENMEKMREAGEVLLSAFGEGFTDLMGATYDKLREVLPLLPETADEWMDDPLGLSDLFSGKTKPNYPSMDAWKGDIEDYAKSTSETSSGGTQKTSTVIINAPSIDHSMVELILDEVNNGLGALS